MNPVKTPEQPRENSRTERLSLIDADIDLCHTFVKAADVEAGPEPDVEGVQ
jgi:hypothetical protein